MKKLNISKLILLTATSLSVSAFSTSYATGYKAISPQRTSNTIIQIQASNEVIQGAQNFVQNVTTRGLKFLQDPNLTEEKRRKEFRSLLTDSFDLRTIGRFVLGRYWRQASDHQKKEYMNLFESMVVNTYSQRFSEYQGQQVAVTRSRAEGDKDVIINSEIISNGNAPDVKLDWRVRYKNGEYRIIDVLVEGVSMTLTQRSEFSSIIQRGGGNIDVLLEKLRNK